MDISGIDSHICGYIKKSAKVIQWGKIKFSINVGTIEHLCARELIFFK